MIDQNVELCGRELTRLGNKVTGPSVHLQLSPPLSYIAALFG